MVQTEFARILADPLELSRQWSREGRKVIGCLDSYIPEEFIHAAGMIPLRILGSTGNVTLADSYLPVFAGKLARSILEQGLRGDLVHLAGVAVSNSSDAVRMLYDLWGRHIPQQRAFLIDVPAILEGETNHRVFRQAMLDFKDELEKFTGKTLESAALRRSIAVFNENRKLLKEMASLLSASPPRLSAETYLDAILSGFVLTKEQHNDLLRQLLESSSGKTSENTEKLVPLHVSGPILVDRSFLPLVRKCGATLASEDLGTGSRYFWDEVDEVGDPVEAIVERYWNKITESYKTPMERRWLHLLNQIERSRAAGVIFVIEKYSDEDQYDYPVWRDRLRSRGIPSLLLDSELVLESEQVRTRVQTFVEIVKGGAFS
ncbi:MAG: 2-hydroxyacyl-CoA dehydratase [Deltaproteobacteria bacterium]|nr:2-hydroxyacyl-CoA dehydratase [Deltaproteobacteria bacterium]